MARVIYIVIQVVMAIWLGAIVCQVSIPMAILCSAVVLMLALEAI